MRDDDEAINYNRADSETNSVTFSEFMAMITGDNGQKLSDLIDEINNSKGE